MVSHRKIAVLMMGVVVASSLALGSPSWAKKRGDSPLDDVNRISWTQLVSKLEGDGYAIREIDMKRGGWKAEVVRDGARYKLRLDAQGNVMRQKRD